MKIPLLLISIMGLGLSLNSHAAEKRYVSDDLSTYVHSGPGTKYRIVGTLNAGKRLNCFPQITNLHKFAMKR